MNWLYYLLEANLYLTAFYLLYKLLLQNTTFYHSNRFYLILSTLLAFFIPFAQIGFLKPVVLPQAEMEFYEVPMQTLTVSLSRQSSPFTQLDYLLYGYWLLACGFGMKFIWSIINIIKLYHNHHKRSLAGFSMIELPKQHAAFSFFNLLFIHPQMTNNKAVIKHELVHIQQKHSIDIIFFELVKIICWFNPFVYLLKRDITLLHEYAADQGTTSNDISKHEYAMFLIENSMAMYSPSLVNQFFNQSILKRRISMLNKEKTTKWARLRFLLGIPLAGLLLGTSTLGFSKNYGYIELLPRQEAPQKETAKNQTAKQTYYPKYKHDNNNNFISLEKRLIVINGKEVKDKNKYYGTAEADKIIFLNSTEAIKKYGSEKGKNGAVEIYGEKATYTFAPPIIKKTNQIKKDQVKFPPTYKPKVQTHFVMNYKTNPENGQSELLEKKLIVINGNAIDNNTKFYGVKHSESVTVLNPEIAIKKYGEAAKFGAVEITGNHLEYLTKMAPLPPAIETPPPGKKLKKFPPPIVKADKPHPNELNKLEVEMVSMVKKKEISPIELEITPLDKKEASNSTPEDIKSLKLEPKPSQKLQELKIEKVKTRQSRFEPTPSSKLLEVKSEDLKQKPRLKIMPSKKTISSENANQHSQTKTSVNTSKETNFIFKNKAWTLYQPQVTEKKEDRC